MNEEGEGFICPQCHENFDKPEDLSSHYENSHSAEASITVAKRTEGKFTDIKDEVTDLQVCNTPYNIYLHLIEQPVL